VVLPILRETPLFPLFISTGSLTPRGELSPFGSALAQLFRHCFFETPRIAILPFSAVAPVSFIFAGFLVPLSKPIVFVSLIVPVSSF